MHLEHSAAPKTLFAFGLNHKTAPVEVREKLYVREAELPELLKLISETLSECLVLSTCNRTEIYGVTDSADIDADYYKQLLIDFKGARDHVRDEHFFTFLSCSACQQLFSVATSIDSRIIGDTQILKQLRGAYSIASHHSVTGKILNQLLQRAFKIGKKTYTETSIHDGAVSASLAAVELATNTFESLRGRSALVIGAGETARLTSEALLNKGVSTIVFSNRTRAHAEELVESLHKTFNFESEIVDFASVKERLDDAEIVITSTGSTDPILRKEDFEGRTGTVLVIDIAVPRDVDEAVAENPSVILRNIDDLNSIIEANHEMRSRDLPKVKKMISTEMADFLTWYYAQPLMPAYEKTASKPDAEQTAEILRIKEFLMDNLSEVHRLATRSTGDFRSDFDDHLSLVRKLQTKKAEAFGAGAI
jgi:glutamyl-tRNA reductase